MCNFQRKFGDRKVLIQAISLAQPRKTMYFLYVFARLVNSRDLIWEVKVD